MNRTNYKEREDPSLQRAIVPEDFPKTRLTFSESEDFNDALAACIDQYTEARTRKGVRIQHITFSDFYKKNGGIVVTCESKTTVNWLDKAIKYIKMPSGVKLRTDDRSILEHRYIIEGKATHSRFNTTNIIETIGRFNNGLDVSKWKIMGERTASGGRIMKIEIDGRSLGAIRKRANKLALDKYLIQRFYILTVERTSGNRNNDTDRDTEIRDEDFEWAQVTDTNRNDQATPENIGTMNNEDVSMMLIRELEEVSQESNGLFDKEGDDILMDLTTGPDEIIEATPPQPEQPSTNQSVNKTAIRKERNKEQGTEIWTETPKTSKINTPPRNNHQNEIEHDIEIMLSGVTKEPQSTNAKTSHKKGQNNRKIGKH
ncbi:uncharacterized protein LOC113463974 [Ceratina calcarata]|uniref:Uncharacterized protein LOC113463974 n=1 Tax=Ceratina calcarata TaxID=156304 RepID=A0AAJ7W8H7_9HYME|nr:uncharacterized protein LOC113463974 [Ceratina calcarata]